MKIKIFLLIFTAITTTLLTSCAGKNIEATKSMNYGKFNLHIDTDTTEDKNQSIVFDKVKTPKKTIGTEIVPIFTKPGHMPKRMGTTTKVFLKNSHQKVKISVEDIPLNKFIHLVFGEILKVNYSVAEIVEKRKDKVTLRMDKKISASKFYAVVEGILSNYNISIDDKDGVLFVTTGGTKNKLKLDYKVSYGTTFQYKNVPENEIVYQILPITYISIDKARDILQEFALSKSEARVYTMESINGLLIKDYASNIKKGIALISMLDHPYMKDKTVKLIFLKHISIIKFYKRIKEIFKVLNIHIAATIKGEPISIMPIDEINAMLVVTDKPELIKTIMYWKSKLDNFEELDNKKQIFVYKTKNRKAEEVAKLLSKLLENEKSSDKESKKSIKSNKKVLKNVPAKLGTKITLDKERNVLIFYMLPSEYKEVYGLLEKIDTKAEQILVEVTIAEVTLVNKLQYGIEWYLKHEGSSSSASIQTLGGLGLGSGGISGIVSAKNISALFSAFAQDNVLNILSSPKLVVLNNKTASFSVGTQVPIITSQATATDLGSNSGGKPTFVQNITYTNTGIQTSITPTITSDNTIMLKLSQSVSEAQNNNTSDISSPIIINRSINTEVLLKHGEELIIAGLIKENHSATGTKVPLLGDIPWLGELFKNYSDTVDRTELLFIVKPYILDKVKDSDAIYSSFAKITGFKE